MSELTTLTKSGKPSHENGGTVKSVSVISTGTGEAHREHIYGTRKPARDPEAAGALRKATSTSSGVSPDSQRQHR
jgi:hypothetical protein